MCIVGQRPWLSDKVPKYLLYLSVMPRHRVTQGPKVSKCTLMYPSLLTYSSTSPTKATKRMRVSSELRIHGLSLESDSFYSRLRTNGIINNNNTTLQSYRSVRMLISPPWRTHFPPLCRMIPNPLFQNKV